MCGIFQTLGENLHERNQWLVVYSNPLREQFVAQQLVENGFSVYLPLTRRRDGISEIPLFSRYLFVRRDNRQSELHHIRGVTGLITIGDAPALVRDSTVQELRAREVNGIIDTELPETNHPNFISNEVIRFIYGAHTGMKGRFNNFTSKHRVDILLDYFGSQRIINTPISSIMPCY